MKRRQFTAEFKRRVVLEVLRGDETVRSIASRHGIHPNQLGKWKTAAHDALLEAFARPGGKPTDRETEQLVERLYARIGELTMERDFFAGYGALGRSEQVRLIREDESLTLSRNANWRV